MKRLFVILSMMVFLIVGFTSAGFSETKYDVIFKDQDVKRVLNNFDSVLERNAALRDYLNVVITENDIDLVVRKGSLNKEKKQFLAENKYNMMRLLQYSLTMAITKIKPAPKDSEFMYVTNVIIKHSNGVSIVKGQRGAGDAATEKALFRGHKLYSLWEIYKKPGEIEKMCDKIITGAMI